MRVITSSNGLLQTLAGAGAELKGATSSENRRKITTGLEAIDSLLPGGCFATGAVHEVLSGTGVPSFILPVLLARSAGKFGWIAWVDANRELFPPALAALGVPLERLLILRPTNRGDELWATAECLRCRGIACCVAAMMGNLSRIEARRLQLAAEVGGGIGVLLRLSSAANRSCSYAAASRWLIKPARGEKMIQRWSVELIHGHGGRATSGDKRHVLLEMSRETNHVRALEAVADRQDQTKPRQPQTASA